MNWSVTPRPTSASSPRTVMRTGKDPRGPAWQFRRTSVQDGAIHRQASAGPAHPALRQPEGSGWHQDVTIESRVDECLDFLDLLPDLKLEHQVWEVSADDALVHRIFPTARGPILKKKLPLPKVVMASSVTT